MNNATKGSIKQKKIGEEELVFGSGCCWFWTQEMKASVAEEEEKRRRNKGEKAMRNDANTRGKR